MCEYGLTAKNLNLIEERWLLPW